MQPIVFLNGQYYLMSCLVLGMGRWLVTYSEIREKIGSPSTKLLYNKVLVKLLNLYPFYLSPL